MKAAKKECFSFFHCLIWFNVQVQHKEYADGLGKVQISKDINARNWATKELIVSPKHSRPEPNRIKEPVTGDLLTDPEGINNATKTMI